MKEYVITIKNHSYQVTIKKIQTDTAIVEVDGKELEVGVDRKVKRHVEPLDIKPVMKSTAMPDTSSSIVAPPSADGTVDEVVSPLPGLILSVMVKKGEAVKKGQTVLKMEAMKMENEIKANRDGKVEEIFVKNGDSVLENTPLVKIAG